MRSQAAACPQAIRAADPFHVVKWATEALDEVRRGAWNDARKLARTEPKRGRGRPRADAPARPGSGRAAALKGARYSLWKNPEVRREAPLPRRGERTRHRSVAADRLKLRAA